MIIQGNVITATPKKTYRHGHHQKVQVAAVVQVLAVHSVSPAQLDLFVRLLIYFFLGKKKKKKKTHEHTGVLSTWSTQHMYQ